MIEPTPDANRVALGVEIARARLAAGLTLEGLAERSGVSRRMLIEVERGRTNASVSTSHAVAHAVNVPLSRLVLVVCEGHEPV